MAFPLLAQLGLALVSSKLQRDEAKSSHENAQRKHFASVLADIDAKRAARAGDSGYMQQAVGGMTNTPTAPRGAGRQTLANLGAALMSQRDAPTTPNAESIGDKPMFQEPIRWSGQDTDDLVDKYGSYA